VVSGLLGRIADQPGERNERERRQDEERRFPDPDEAVEYDDERPEREQGIEDFARQGARTLPSAACA
jgi:hypothetical protein